MTHSAWTGKEQFLSEFFFLNPRSVYRLKLFRTRPIFFLWEVMRNAATLFSYFADQAVHSTWCLGVLVLVIKMMRCLKALLKYGLSPKKLTLRILWQWVNGRPWNRNRLCWRETTGVRSPTSSNDCLGSKYKSSLVWRLFNRYLKYLQSCVSNIKQVPPMSIPNQRTNLIYCNQLRCSNCDDNHMKTLLLFHFHDDCMVNIQWLIKTWW